jgi:ketosteroid isomerase-like protein
MSEENVQLAKRMLEAFGRRDVDALLEITDPEVAFFAPTGELVTGDAAYWGHQGIKDYFDDVSAAWQELGIVPNRYRSVGENVLVIGRVYGKRTDGEVFNSPAQWVLRARNGKIVYGCVYTDKQEALRAVGLLESQEDEEA